MRLQSRLAPQPLLMAAGAVVAAKALLAMLPREARAPTGIDAENASNKSAVAERFDAWAAGTGSPFDLLADEATWTIVGRSAASGTYPDRESFMREVIRPFNARMRDPLKPVVREIYSDRDTVIVFFDARGVALDGGEYNNTYTWYLQMRSGRAISATAFFDSIEFDALWNRVAPPASTPC
jgi:ketosteroid isomerase-like protein